MRGDADGKMSAMRLPYDERVRTAYLYVGDPAERTGALTTHKVNPPNASAADDYLSLDFDEAGRLVGIEFLVPDDRLLPSALATAERFG
jgi:uncharacterized protein YuzE